MIENVLFLLLEIVESQCAIVLYEIMSIIYQGTTLPHVIVHPVLSAAVLLSTIYNFDAVLSVIFAAF